MFRFCAPTQSVVTEPGRKRSCNQWQDSAGADQQVLPVAAQQDSHRAIATRPFRHVTFGQDQAVQDHQMQGREDRQDRVQRQVVNNFIAAFFLITLKAQFLKSYPELFRRYIPTIFRGCYKPDTSENVRGMV